MFERFTPTARRAVFYSSEEAAQFGSPYIETEHLLLGVLRADSSLVETFGLHPDAIRATVNNLTLGEDRADASVNVPLTPESAHALRIAAEEADSLGQQLINAGHLLLGLLQEKKSLAAELLREGGLKPESVRRRLANDSGYRSGPLAST